MKPLKKILNKIIEQSEKEKELEDLYRIEKQLTDVAAQNINVIQEGPFIRNISFKTNTIKNMFTCRVLKDYFYNIPKDYIFEVSILAFDKIKAKVNANLTIEELSQFIFQLLFREGYYIIKRGINDE